MPFIAYKITHRESGKAYVGITTQKRPETRWRHHANVGRRGIGTAIKKYGEAAFLFEIVASAFDIDSLLELEAVLICQDRTLSPLGYNLNEGGKGTLKASLETRKLIGEANSRRIWTEDAREKARCRLLGKPRSPESIAKQAASCTGKPVSEEARRKISEKAKARWKDPSYAAVAGKACVGRMMSPETRAKIAASVARYAAQRKAGVPS